MMTPKNTIDRKNVEELKELLGQLKRGDLTPDQQNRLQQLMQAVDASTLGQLEQEIIREGVSREEIRSSLCDIHLAAMGDSLNLQVREVEPPHPVHTLMEEHKSILQFLDSLESTAGALDSCSSYQEAAELLPVLHTTAEALIDTEKHHQREEEALFPFLEVHDVQEPPAIMVMDHEEFWPKKERLQQLTREHPADFAAFRDEVGELARSLASGLRDHIKKEDSIIYQMALQNLSEEEWLQVKERCDRIGYCGFSPKER